MVINFDKVTGKYEVPDLTLHNPNGKQIDIIGLHNELSITLRYNALSEMSFRVNNVEGITYYHKLRPKRLVKVRGIGVFMITTSNEIDNGVETYREIQARSLEMELNYKSVTLLEGTYKFYDLVDIDKSLMGIIFSSLPNWKIGQIDSDLWNIHRTFDLTSQTVYGFLMGNVEEAYECVFEFDTFNKTVSAKAKKNVINKTDIQLSHENLIKQINIGDDIEKITTCLEVYGANELSINMVNPLGTSYIYNFSHYKNEDWMSKELVQAITNWENKTKTQQPIYANLLTQLKEENKKLLTLKNELNALDTEYVALEGVQKARIEQGLSYTDIWNQMEDKKVEIANKKKQIENKEKEIKNIQDSKNLINQDLSFLTNFTGELYKELDNFIIATTYQNDCFLVTDGATQEQEQSTIQDLYDKAQELLGDSCKPSYTFTTDVINFLFLEEYKHFTQQLTLGSSLNIYMENSDKFVYPVLLELGLNFEENDCSNVLMTFSDKLRLDNADMILAELLESNSISSDKVGWNGGKWSQYDKDKGDINKFINSSLDASVNAIKSSENEEIVLNGNGLRGRRLNPDTQLYDPQQVWLTSRSLVYSSDSFKTAKLALGEIEFNGQKLYGLVSDALIGKMIIGNQLLVQNENNKFIVDGDGASLVDAKFILSTTDGKGKIILDPDQGIKIQSNKVGAGAFEDVLYMDTQGNLNMKGVLKGATGSFSGDLTASNLIGGTINIGNGNFKVSASGDCVANSLAITGGTISIGNKFKVDNYGNVTATSITITGQSTLDAKDMVVRNLVVGGNVIMGANATISWGNVTGTSGVALKGDIPKLPSYIQSTKITRTSIESPTITGGELIGGTITQTSSSSRYTDCELIGGRLQFVKGSTYYGSVMGDANDRKMWIEGNNALKLTSVNGGISLTPAGGSKVYFEGHAVAENDLTLKGRLLDANGNQIKFNATFA